MTAPSLGDQLLDTVRQRVGDGPDIARGGRSLIRRGQIRLDDLGPGQVVARADDGTVALISKSLGGLGTIVLIRHDNEFLSVYGRVSEVTVAKGDRVSRGQTIAQVADLASPRKPHLHFEIRKGAESVDPEQYY